MRIKCLLQCLLRQLQASDSVQLPKTSRNSTCSGSLHLWVCPYSLWKKVHCSYSRNTFAAYFQFHFETSNLDASKQFLLWVCLVYVFDVFAHEMGPASSPRCRVIMQQETGRRWNTRNSYSLRKPFSPQVWFHCMGTGVQEVCEISILENAQSSPGQGPEQPALAEHVLNRVFPNGLQAPPQCISFCSSELCVQGLLLECAVYYMSRKAVGLIKIVLCGRKGSTNQLLHCTELLFRLLFELSDIKLQHVMQYEQPQQRRS